MAMQELKVRWTRAVCSGPTQPHWAQHPLAWAMLLCGGLTLAGCSSSPSKQQAAHQQARAMASTQGRAPAKRSSGYAPVRSSAQTRPYTAASGVTSQSALLDEDSLDSLEGLLEATDMEAVESNRLAILKHGDVWRRMRAGFRMNLAYENSRINAQRNWFISRQTYLDRLSARASRYLYHTVTEAEKRGIPTELALLPVIESSYDPGATSNAAAAGLWQFIPSTGQLYGLKQTATYDGRRDVVESTRAAYDFLTSLYNKFGSWELALASYNAGPGRIQQAINRNAAAGLPTDYWSLRLPQETMNYVPRFLAVAQIVQNPDRFGVRLNPIANRPHFRQVALPGVVDLGLVSQITGLTSQEIYELNPAFRYGQTDPEAPGRLLIPNALSADMDNKLSRMPTLSAYQSRPQAATLVQSVTLRQSTGISTGEAAALMGTPASVSASAPPVAAAITRTPPASSAAPAGRPAPAPATPARVVLPRDPAALAALANAGLTPGGVPKLAVPSSAVVNVSTEEPPLSVQEQARVRAELVTPPVLTAATSLTETARPVTPAPSPAQVSAAQAAVPPVQVAPTSPAPSVTVPVVSQNAVEAAVVAAAVPNTEPALSAVEKARVVAEIEAVAPAGTTVVDPLDGRIKLSAIQTQQSVLDAKGEDRRVRYETVQALPATATPARALSMPTPSASTARTLAVVAVKAPKPRGERTVYLVQPGDTLTGVARRYGVDAANVADWNQMERTANLIAGTPLYLYGVKEPAKPTSYVVQPGDTLTAVAARFDLTPQQLASYNDGLSATSNLMAGSRLQLTEPKGAARTTPAANPAPAKATSPSAADTDDYTVQKGDSLRSVASRYGLSVTELARLNGVPSTIALKPGDTLSVPATVASPSARKGSTSRQATVSYTVKPGEGLIALASRYGMSVEALAELNDTDPQRSLMVGEKIRVPRGAPEADDPPAAKTPERKPARSAEPTTVSYTIRRGESLQAIARRYGLSSTELASLNGIPASASVRAGDTLNVPQAQNDDSDSKAAASTSRRSPAAARDTDQEKKGNYIVKKGDTLRSVAARHGITHWELAKLNGVASTASLTAGDRLLLPEDFEKQPGPADARTAEDKTGGRTSSKTTTRSKDSQDGSQDSAAEAKDNKAKAARTSAYTVKSGETLARIAARHGLSLAELAEINQIPAQTRIQAGDTLEVPAAAKPKKR